MEDDGDDKDDSKRRTRNISEKKRRDQFNFLVNELSTMVTASNRKMDKSTVLKSTISFLKNHNEITVRSRLHDVQEDWKPSFLSNVEFTYLVLEALEGFVMVFSVTGRIYYVSESVTSLLGYNVGELLNKSIFDLTYEQDRPNLFNLLQNPRIAADSMQRAGQDNEIRFQCHLRRGTPDPRQESIYELIEFNGHFRPNTEPVDNEEIYQQEQESRLLFVCSGRLSSPQLVRDVSLADSAHNEFTSRHSLEWKFLFLDHRAPPIIGYLPFEVLGTSGYDYYHFDDLEKVVSCHESLMQKGELTSCYYRFLTKGQQWIWLQTRFYITYHQWNSKPEFVVCTHRVVNDADVAKEAAPCESAPVKEPTEESPMSPAYMSDMETYTPCQPMLQSAPSAAGSASAASAASAAGTWRGARYASESSSRFRADSNPTSVSGSSCSSQRNSLRETSKPESTAEPQWAIGTQYLEPAPYVTEALASGQGVIALPTLPIIIAPDHAQIQEQLQQKHEKLKQMIVLQQEELRQVKEQLLLARLGILQPLPSGESPYAGNEIENAAIVQPEIVYEEQPGRPAYPGCPPPDPRMPQ